MERKYKQKGYHERGREEKEGAQAAGAETSPGSTRAANAAYGRDSHARPLRELRRGVGSGIRSEW